MNKEISRAVIRRMPRYHRYLGELLREGVERISSSELSARMNVTASQIRQDLNNFGGFGHQGYGYNVQHLYDEIGKILGLTAHHNMIIVGVGNLGQALANYGGFMELGVFLVGLFDIDPWLEGRLVGGLPVRMMDDLGTFTAACHVDIAAITTTKAAAKEAANQLVGYGIRAFWNFACLDLDVAGQGIVVENVHLSDTLMHLSYNILRSKEEQGQDGTDCKQPGDEVV